jgi:hypothetical protein
MGFSSHNKNKNCPSISKIAALTIVGTVSLLTFMYLFGLLESLAINYDNYDISTGCHRNIEYNAKTGKCENGEDRLPCALVFEFDTILSCIASCGLGILLVVTSLIIVANCVLCLVRKRTLEKTYNDDFYELTNEEKQVILLDIKNLS